MIDQETTILGDPLQYFNLFNRNLDLGGGGGGGKMLH